MPGHETTRAVKIYYFLSWTTVIILLLAIPFLFLPDDSDQGAQANFAKLKAGKISGVKLSIPAEYFVFPYEYIGRSIWSPGESGNQNETDEISSFTLYVEWPSLAPHSESNNDSYSHSLSESISENWIRIAVTATRESPESLIVSGQNGLARVLQGHLYHPERYGDPGNITYKNNGLDESLGLETLIPVGQRPEQLWKVPRFYWQGDISGLVAVYIECSFTNESKNIDEIKLCRENYYLSDINSYVVITFAPAHLSSWKDLQEMTENLILSFLPPHN